jgi:hypothetical protein
MATTTNYGWDTPDDTDLVKDGALAIRDLGQDIDTSLYNKIYGVNRTLAANNNFSNPTTFTDMPNAADKTALDLSVVKKQASSLLLVNLSMPMYFNSGGNQNMLAGINIGGTDYAIGVQFVEGAVDSTYLTGSRIITGLGAGTYAVKPRFASSTAASVIMVSGNIVSYTVQELAQ